MHYRNVVKWAERRIKPRHKAHCLQVSLRSGGLKGLFRSAAPAFCIDFNRYGMAIESQQSFRAKERVLLAFKGKYISQSNVEGVIQNCVLVDGVYRISVVFSYALSSKNYSRKIDNALSRIERLYHEAQSESQPSEAQRQAS